MASAKHSEPTTSKDGADSPCSKADDQPGYRLVDDESQIEPALAEIRRDLAGASRGSLAVDCEALNLSRRGELSLVSLATSYEAPAFLFDVKNLGGDVFKRGLGDLLEDANTEKLMFDCRNDSDCLWHLFGIKMVNVLDLQMLEIILREERGEITLSYNPGVKGLQSCFETYLDDAHSQLVTDKKQGRVYMNQDSKVWLKRPLECALLDYAAGDVRGLLPLHRKLVGAGCSDGALSRARAASADYLDFYRTKARRLYDQYECNGFLPMYVVPPKGSESVSRWGHSTECYGCHRLFPRHDFSKNQLRKGTPRCPVCKLVKEGIDRAKKWRHNECYESEPEDDGW